MGAGLLALLLVLCPAARAATADPSLTPEFEQRRRAPRPAAAPRRPEGPAPEEPVPDAPAPLPEPARLRRPDLDEREKARPRPHFIARSWAWYASGSLNVRFNYQIPPAQVTPPGDVFIGQTQKRNAKGLMVVDSVEIAPFSWISVQGEYGRQRARGGFTSHSWVDAQNIDVLTYSGTGAEWRKPDHEDDLVYTADAGSFRDWSAATVYVRLLGSASDVLEGARVRHSMDVGLGAERYRQNTRATNLVLAENRNKYFDPGTPTGPVPGYDSTYEAVWRGPHLALRDEVEGDEFSLQGAILYSPIVEFTGKGFSNLSAQSGSGRASPPNFADWSHGTAFHLFVALGWSPWKPLRLEAGYQRLYFTGRTGKRRFYNGDGTVSDYQLDMSNAELAGFFGGASIRF